MKEYWELAENSLWRRKWLFFWRFDRERASQLAYVLMQRAFDGFDALITVDEDKRIHAAIVDFIRANAPRKPWEGHRYLWVAMECARDPRRFAMKMSQLAAVGIPGRPEYTQVEWTYDFRPGAKIQGRQMNDYSEI